MTIIRYGKLEISQAQQSALLDNLPAPKRKDCYFDEDDLAALVMRTGADEVCKHCGQPSLSGVSRRQARQLAQRLLDNWRQISLITYSTVLDKYRRLP